MAGILNSHPSTSSHVAGAMVRQLANLQPEIVPFMEQSGSFFTVAGRVRYDRYTSGFPKGMLRFDRLYYDMGQVPHALEVVDPDTIRFYQEQPAVAYPRLVAWLEGVLQFGPPPAGAYEVKWDITLDSKLDTPTGDEITTASTTQTNPWFTEGAVPFKHLVLADYYMSSPDQRPEMAQNQTGLAQSALNRLRSAQMKRQAMNSTPVTPNAFDTYHRRSERVQILHPGARG